MMATVLIGEAVDDIRLALTLLFRGDGHRVVAVDDGAAVRRAAPIERPDLVVLDLPNRRSLDVTRALRADPNTARTAIMVLSASLTPSECEAFAATANDYVPMPFDNRDLLSRAHELLAARRAASRDGFDVRIEPDPLRGLIIVRAVGQLSLVTWYRLHAAATKSLAEAPSAVIVDLRGVRLVGAAPHAAILHLQQMADCDPATGMFWCVRGELADRLRRLVPHMELFGTVADAATRAGAGRIPVPWVRGRYPATGVGVGRAVAGVDAACIRWGLDHLRRPARVIVAELTGLAGADGSEVIVTARLTHTYVLITARAGHPAANAPRSDRVRWSTALLDAAIAVGRGTACDGRATFWATLRITWRKTHDRFNRDSC